MTRILLVEDEEDLRASVARLLRERGYEVDEAGDGEEGLERLRSAGGAYGLVICDVTMPVLDGLSMLQAAEEGLGDARILLISGYALDAPDMKGRPYVALRKPIAHSQIVDEAGALLAA